MSTAKKVVLGFSGGLDTTYCVKYLSEDKGYEIHSVIVNTGGFSAAELQQIEAHAYKLGVKKPHHRRCGEALLRPHYKIPGIWQCAQKTIRTR
jgi:Argininosuccinate synthase